MTKAPKILIAAGGTGGHIYPALAMADAFKRARPDAIVEFVGTAHGLENKIIPPKGYLVHHLPIGRLNSNVPLSERLATVAKLPLALIKSARLLRARKPEFVLGVGGHASGPLLLMGALLGYRTAIWEPNAMPGLANRILSRFVGECWVVFEDARRWLKGQQMHTAGMPVRSEIEEMPTAFESSTVTKPISASSPSSSSVSADKPFRILVFGGSQGARGVNTAVAEMLKASPEWSQGLKVVHQTGPADFARVRELYGEFLANGIVDLREYLHDMGQQYAWADLVICRSGTGTLSELAACGKVSILIPFPFASDDHQRKNAESLVNKGAARMILQKDLTPASLREAIDQLRRDPQMRQTMSARIRDFHHPRAAERLVGEFLERIETSATS